MKKTKLMAGILALSLGMTALSAAPMAVWAENETAALAETEKVTDLEKIKDILYKGLTEHNKELMENDPVNLSPFSLSIAEDSNGNKFVIVFAGNKFDDISKETDKIIEKNNIDHKYVAVYDILPHMRNFEKLAVYIKENDLDAVIYAFGNHPSVAYYEEDTATIEALDSFLKENEVDGLKRIPYKGSKPEGGMITDYAFIYEKLYRLIEEENIPAIIFLTLGVVEGKVVEANSIYGFGGDFDQVISLRLDGTYVDDERSIDAVEKMFAEENIDPTVVEWWMLEGGSVNDNANQGDANCDGIVNMADAVLIMQSLANPDKYGTNGTDERHLTAQGEKNADIAGDNDGVTNLDALAVQKKLLKLE